MTEHYDAIVIGAGQAGPPLAERLGKEGLKTAIVERHLMGGTCVNTGCTPTKTLVASARVAHLARRAEDYGVKIDAPVNVDMARVKARKDEIVAAANQGVTRWVEGMENVTLIRGHACFEDAHSLSVNGRTLTAERIFINVGARARVPDLPDLDEVGYLTSSSIMDLDFIPGHLVIIGGSYIGLEFAQMYRRFGARVTVVEMKDRLIGHEDQEVSDTVRKFLEDEGITVRLEAECLSVERGPEGVRVNIECGHDATPIEGSHLLLAVGRVPNTDDLGLENAGIETDERGHIRVDDALRTNIEGVWALGEVNGQGAFTHTSYNDYEIVVANLFDDDPRRVSDRIPCYALYTDPPLGRAGMTEREARDSGRNVLVGRLEMSAVARAREQGETRGFMKVLVDADSGEILGATLLGLHGDEVVHVLLDVMYAGRPYTVISRAVHIHPTVSELLPTMLQSLRPLE